MRTPDEEDLHLANAVAALEAPPVTAGEARRRMLNARRWVNTCLDAGQYDEATRLFAESNQLAALAEKLERKVA